MTQYGKITHYDAPSGSGMIAPEQGGDALPFHRSGLQQQGQEPRSDQLYTYETQMDATGQAQAFNLQAEQGDDAGQMGSGQNANAGGFDQQGQSQNRAHQDSERRTGVDAQNGREARNNEQSGGSTFQPLAQSQGDRDQQLQDQRGQNQQGQNQGRGQQGENEPGQNQQGLNQQGQNQQVQGQNRANPQGVSRAGAAQPGAERDTMRGMRSQQQEQAQGQSFSDRNRQGQPEPGRNQPSQNPPIPNPPGHNDRRR